MEASEKLEYVKRYINGVSAHDIEAIKAIYDDNATVEDPVGTDPHVGIDAICKFYEQAFNAELKLELAGPVRYAGNAAVFPFVCTVILGDSKLKIDAIDIFEFNQNGKVQTMRAYWGPENCSSE
ncbi:MAG: steroid delta-isomerase [Dehalococcoidia bacterium]|nr:MAG: steroid delta-isomerase [Dehalococcoidia bacterium]